MSWPINVSSKNFFIDSKWIVIKKWRIPKVRGTQQSHKHIGTTVDRQTDRQTEKYTGRQEPQPTTAI
jgi:hypothetical protein